MTRAFSLRTATTIKQKLVDKNDKRITLSLYNAGTATVYLGDNMVTTTIAKPIIAGAYVNYAGKEANDELWFIAGSDQNIIIEECEV